MKITRIYYRPYLDNKVKKKQRHTTNRIKVWLHWSANNYTGSQEQEVMHSVAAICYSFTEFFKMGFSISILGSCQWALKISHSNLLFKCFVTLLFSRSLTPIIRQWRIHLSLSRLILTLYKTWSILLIMTSLWYLSGYTFEFIKAVSDTVFDMINSAYYDKPLILIELYVWVYERLFLTLY